MKRAFHQAAKDEQPCAHAQRLEAIMQTISLLSPGRELLDLAIETDVDIRLVPELKFHGGLKDLKLDDALIGLFINDSVTGKKEIQLLDSASDAQLVPFLVHELRHVQQAAQLGANPMLFAGFPNMYEAMLMQRVMEADAQLFTILFCTQLLELKQPEYMEAFVMVSQGAIALGSKPPLKGTFNTVCREIFFAYQEHETHVYDDIMRRRIEDVVKLFPDAFETMGPAAEGAFRHRTKMRDFARMTAINGGEYLKGLKRKDLTRMFERTLSDENRAFIKDIRARVEAGRIPAANENKPTPKGKKASMRRKAARAS